VQIQLKTHSQNTTYFKASILFNTRLTMRLLPLETVSYDGEGQGIEDARAEECLLMLESMSKDGVPERGSFSIVGDLFQTNRRTMGNLGAKSIASMLLF
jgi:hypothetical protein